MNINYGEYAGWVLDEWMNMQDGSWRILAVAGDVRSRGSQAWSFRTPRSREVIIPASRTELQTIA